MPWREADSGWCVCRRRCPCCWPQQRVHRSFQLLLLLLLLLLHLLHLLLLHLLLLLLLLHLVSRSRRRLRRQWHQVAVVYR